MDIIARRKERLEEAKRVLELEEFFAEKPWNWEWKSNPNVQVNKTRKLFKDESFQFLMPSIRKEA